MLMEKRHGPDEVKLGRKGDRPYWVLIFSIFVRAAHQVGAAVFLGSFLLGDGLNMPRGYLIIACVSGVVLMITEGIRHRQLFRECSGMITLVKLAVLALAFKSVLPPAPLILFSFVMASVFSHAPKSIRHRLIF